MTWTVTPASPRLATAKNPPYVASFLLEPEQARDLLRAEVSLARSAAMDLDGKTNFHSSPEVHSIVFTTLLHL